MANSKIPHADFTVRTISRNLNVNENATAYQNLKTIIDEDLPSGYRCLGVVGFTSNNNNAFFISCRYIDYPYSLQIRNTSSSAISCNVTIHYLCTNQ